jgi:hypothetical protein
MTTTSCAAFNAARNSPSASIFFLMTKTFFFSLPGIGRTVGVEPVARTSFSYVKPLELITQPETPSGKALIPLRSPGAAAGRYLCRDGWSFLQA